MISFKDREQSALNELYCIAMEKAQLSSDRLQAARKFADAIVKYLKVHEQDIGYDTHERHCHDAECQRALADCVEAENYYLSNYAGTVQSRIFSGNG